MKIRRLSEIDLARFCALPEGEPRVHALRRYKIAGGSWSYDPVRQSTSDILNARTPLMGALGKVSWSKIERQIKTACGKNPAQFEANAEAGKVLYEHAHKEGWRSVKEEMSRMPVGFTEAVRFWCDIVVDDGDGPFIPFFDHRRANGVSNAAIRQIIYSMQDVWVRARNMDLVDARLAIVRFPPDDEGRSISLEFADDVELLPYDELNARVTDVYRLWGEVLDERAEETRKTGTGDGTPFGF